MPVSPVFEPQTAAVRRRQPEQSAVGFEEAFEIGITRLAARGLAVPFGARRQHQREPEFETVGRIRRAVRIVLDKIDLDPANALGRVRLEMRFVIGPREAGRPVEHVGEIAIVEIVRRRSGAVAPKRRADAASAQADEASDRVKDGFIGASNQPRYQVPSGPAAAIGTPGSRLVRRMVR